jgi:hypothetical protein
MGVDVYVLDFLLDVCKSESIALGDLLTLGRQGFHVPAAAQPLARDVLFRHFPNRKFSEINQGDFFADRLFEFLGANSIEVLDNSAFEDATIIHDLNRPVPVEAHGHFDSIIDGGTLEHIFNVSQAFDNIAKMLRVGGTVFVIDAANNMLGHGMYQFSTELLWTVFSPDNGFSILSMRLVETWGAPSPKPARNPREAGVRLEIGRTSNPTYVMMAAKKINEVATLEAQQSDYVASWQKFLNNP